MVIDYRQIGRLGPEQIKKDMIYYECWASNSIEYMALEDPVETESGVWQWKAMNMTFKHLPIKRRSVITVIYDEKKTMFGPYLYDYPAYVPIDKEDQNLIY